jgi:hypothetical protein
MQRFCINTARTACRQLERMMSYAAMVGGWNTEEG